MEFLCGNLVDRTRSIKVHIHRLRLSMQYKCAKTCPRDGPQTHSSHDPFDPRLSHQTINITTHYFYIYSVYDF